MFFSTRRERWLWGWLGLYLAVIYGSAYGIQFLLEALRDANLLRSSVGVVFALGGGGVALALVRRRPGRAETAVLLFAALAYLVALGRLTIVQERFHLIQYGLLAGLAEATFAERWRRVPRRWWRRPVVAAALLTAVAGWGDEILQYFLPNRTYDLRDVRLNALSGLLLLAVLVARRAARRWESQQAQRSVPAGGALSDPP